MTATAPTGETSVFEKVAQSASAVLASVVTMSQSLLPTGYLSDFADPEMLDAVGLKGSNTGQVRSSLLEHEDGEIANHIPPTDWTNMVCAMLVMTILVVILYYFYRRLAMMFLMFYCDEALWIYRSTRFIGTCWRMFIFRLLLRHLIPRNKFERDRLLELDMRTLSKSLVKERFDMLKERGIYDPEDKHLVHRAISGLTVGLPSIHFQHDPHDYRQGDPVRRIMNSSVLADTNAVIYLDDVDTRWEPDFLNVVLAQGRPTILYTRNPMVLARYNEREAITTDASGMITTSTLGRNSTTEWAHDWSRDVLDVISMPPEDLLYPEDATGELCPFVSFSVSRLQLSDTHCLIMLDPILQGTSVTAHLWNQLKPVDRLKRWTPTVMGAAIVIQTTDTFIIADMEKATQQYVLTKREFSDFLRVKKNSASTTMLDRLTRPEDKQRFELLHLLVSMNGALGDIRRIVGTEKVGYTPLFSDKDLEDVVVPGTVIFNPIIDGCFIPTKCHATSLHSVNKRLIELQSKEKRIPDRYWKYQEEFVNVLCYATPGDAKPDHTSDVIEQFRSTLQCKYRNADDTPMTEGRVNKCMLKIAPMPDMAPGRNISVVNAENVLMLARYTKPLANFLKAHTKWYGFGKTPRDTAMLVHELCAQNHSDFVLVEGDFSKYDGTQNTYHSALLLRLLLELYDIPYHENIYQSLDELSYMIFTIPYGGKYNSKDTRKSGSSCTSVGNTLVHALAQYIHFRELGYTIDEAYKMIGICAGDDGLIMTPCPAKYAMSCAEMSLVLTFNVRSPGDEVGFLGRFYINPWDSPLSYFDPYRCLSKLHYSECTDLSISKETKAFRKASGYLVTDHDNFLGHIMRVILIISREGKTEVALRNPTVGLFLTANTHYTAVELLHLVDSDELADTAYPTLSSSFDTLRTSDGSWDPAVTHLSRQLGLLEEPLEYSPEDIYDWWLKFRTVEKLEDIANMVDTPLVLPKFAYITTEGQVLGPDPGPAPVIPKVDPTERVCCRWIQEQMFRDKGYVLTPCTSKCLFAHAFKGRACRSWVKDFTCPGFSSDAGSVKTCKFDHPVLSQGVTLTLRQKRSGKKK